MCTTIAQGCMCMYTDMHSKQLAFVPQIDFGDLYVSLEDIPALDSACRLLSCCCIIDNHWDSCYLTQQLQTIAASRPDLLHSTVNTGLNSLSSVVTLRYFHVARGASRVCVGAASVKFLMSANTCGVASAASDAATAASSRNLRTQIAIVPAPSSSG